MRVTDDNKRVAKNTLVLYCRMIMTLLVSLYTSRVVLNALGIEYFGIYNVVGGIVASLSFLQQTLVMSFQRFFCKYIPKGNIRKLSEIMGAATIIVIIICLIATILVETLGVWFLNNKLLISPSKIYAANVVLQLSLLTFVFTIFRAVYNAVIISYEEMAAFAYISIFEVICKLVVAFLISFSTFDRLIYYGFLMLCVSVFISLLYFAYVKVRFVNIKHDLMVIKNKHIFVELSSFMGFSTIGTMANVVRNQGLNFILNMFYGPVVNAARSISLQVYTAVSSFTHSFQTAFSPSMMKRCETAEKREIEDTIIIVSKFSFYAMLMLSYPIFIYSQFILEFWLGHNNVPEYTAFFTRICLLIGLIETLSNPIVNVIMASGKIKGFMIFVSIILLFILPLSYFLLTFGVSPIVVYVADLILSVLAQLIRVLYLKKIEGLSLRRYSSYVVSPILLVCLILAGVAFPLTFWGTSLRNMIMGSILSEMLLTFIIFYVGMTHTERLFFMNKCLNYAKRYCKYNKNGY